MAYFCLQQKAIKPMARKGNAASVVVRRVACANATKTSCLSLKTQHRRDVTAERRPCLVDVNLTEDQYRKCPSSTPPISPSPTQLTLSHPLLPPLASGSKAAVTWRLTDAYLDPELRGLWFPRYLAKRSEDAGQSKTPLRSWKIAFVPSDALNDKSGHRK